MESLKEKLRREKGCRKRTGQQLEALPNTHERKAPRSEAIYSLQFLSLAEATSPVHLSDSFIFTIIYPTPLLSRKVSLFPSQSQAGISKAAAIRVSNLLNTYSDLQPLLFPRGFLFPPSHRATLRSHVDSDPIS